VEGWCWTELHHVGGICAPLTHEMICSYDTRSYSSQGIERQTLCFMGVEFLSLLCSCLEASCRLSCMPATHAAFTQTTSVLSPC
jgi:hypothetical protein